MNDWSKIGCTFAKSNYFRLEEFEKCQKFTFYQYELKEQKYVLLIKIEF